MANFELLCVCFHASACRVCKAMKSPLVAVVAAVASLPYSFALTLSAASMATPTQKVISMLTDLKTTGHNMMEEEQHMFAKYAEWVDDESKRLVFEIQDGAASMERLKSFIAKAESDAKELQGHVKDLGVEIDKLTAEKTESAAVRKEQHEEYSKVSEDFSESVDALSRAIEQLSAQNYDRAQAEGLIQQTAVRVPGLEEALAALQAERGSDAGAPEVASYEFQSGGILEMLQGLLDKFKRELSEVQGSETNQAHEYELVQMHLGDTIAKDTSDRSEREQRSQTRLADSAKAQGELGEVSRGTAEDEALKKEIESTFAVKQTQYQENQRIRTDELAVIHKAIEIVSSPQVAGSYGEHVNFAQRAVSLLQVGSSMRLAKDAAVSLLETRARSLDSTSLAQLAAAMATIGPFSKVVEMIESLIARLKEEAAAEADHKAWCDEQLKSNKLKRETKSAKVEELFAQLGGLSASISAMGAQSAKLSEEQAQLTQAMQEATDFRQKENTENLATMVDAKAGAEAVNQAVVLLKEFYSGQAAFLQQQQVPDMGAYKGMQTSSGGIIGMLEVIASDFMRLLSATEASEKAALKEYGDFMATSDASKKAKHEEEFKLKLDKDQAEFEKVEADKDLKSVEDELGEANEFFERLKPSCLQVHVSFEERAAKRKDEIQSLKEAYAIMDRKGKE